MTKFARRADGDAASSEKCAHKPSAVNSRPVDAADNYSLADLRLRCDVEKINGLGSVRVWLELLLELGRRHQIQADVASTAAKFAARLTPELLAITGADRMPPLPIHYVPLGCDE